MSVSVLTLHLLGLPVALSSDPLNAVPPYCYRHRPKPKAADIARTVYISFLGFLRWLALGYFLEKVPRVSKCTVNDCLDYQDHALLQLRVYFLHPLII